MGEHGPWIDISTPLTDGMAVYPGDPEVRLRRVLDMERGDPFTLSAIEAGLHSGTHVEAPVHFIPGSGGIETIDLNALLGDAVVVDVRWFGEGLTAADVARFMPAGCERVLFRTVADSGSSGPVLTMAAAGELLKRGVRLLGIDSLSVAPSDDPSPVHVALLEAGVVIVVGLDLRSIEAGRYELLCLPLLIPGADGAPARALLRARG
ncbi:MAG: cyclase family protein [Dehalococcoidia bacterium]|nr:cyclase family protein [Dehalococcoidia bacterium]MCB9484752.1 cyclase family protein [Thermoflexaceae bacterium]